MLPSLQVVFAITTNLVDKMKLVDYYRTNSTQKHHKKTVIGSWTLPQEKSTKKLLGIQKSNSLLLMNRNFHTTNIRNDLMGIHYNVRINWVSNYLIVSGILRHLLTFKKYICTNKSASKNFRKLHEVQIFLWSTIFSFVL